MSGNRYVDTPSNNFFFSIIFLSSSTIVPQGSWVCLWMIAFELRKSKRNLVRSVSTLCQGAYRMEDIDHVSLHHVGCD